MVDVADQGVLYNDHHTGGLRSCHVALSLVMSVHSTSHSNARHHYHDRHHLYHHHRWLVSKDPPPSHQSAHETQPPEWLVNDAQWPVAPEQPYYVMVPVCSSSHTLLTDAALQAAVQGQAAPAAASDAGGVDIDWTYLDVLEKGVRPLRDVLTGGDDAALHTLLQQPDGACSGDG